MSAFCFSVSRTETLFFYFNSFAINSVNTLLNSSVSTVTGFSVKKDPVG
ncbi:hypothetical protein BN1044_02750 [Hafnia alvei]|uniref:Uncharacterized protein n=1 Tax=Hafnia alvei TaxID=569 RepID=A0A1C6Z230_HAFAL|nr:hypothetical protein BN1044_02750 [Hafnia alvei]